jgi:hypothetical protein
MHECENYIKKVSSISSILPTWTTSVFLSKNYFDEIFDQFQHFLVEEILKRKLLFLRHCFFHFCSKIYFIKCSFFSGPKRGYCLPICCWGWKTFSLRHWRRCKNKLERFFCYCRTSNVRGVPHGWAPYGAFTLAILQCNILPSPTMAI